VFDKLRNKGKVSEADLDSALKDLRLSLLESDVNFLVVKDFVSRVKEKALGAQILKTLTPAQQIIKIVNEELIDLLGGSSGKPGFAPSPPTVFMLAGLQGGGKTTAAAKLALWLKKMGKKTMLIAADTQRPAAVDQLQQLGKEIDVEVYAEPGNTDAKDIVKNGILKSKSSGFSGVIVDTAGRTHVDESLMNELKEIKAMVKPHHMLLVVDAMTGQDAVKLANTFDAEVGIDGIIVTKLDGDSRGGAALSVKAVTGKPIRFASFGEKIDAFDLFHPDRMASRILGMGDVLTLIEKAEDSIEKEKAEELQKKMLKGKYDLEDFLAQMKSIKKMGPISQLLKMLPNMPGMKGISSINFDDKQVSRMEAVVLSMTPKERTDPSILSSSRRQRIAKGSGTSVNEVNNLIKSYTQSKKILKQLSGRMPFGKLNLPFMG
jgi:signal recognition particle subunit SRP54